MQEWCLQHPWMTFFILVTLAESVGKLGRVYINRNR